jgi:hypothetical protein
MFKSEAERIIRKAMEESGAKFTEEQIQALTKIIPKIAALIVEEAFSSYRPGSSGKPSFFGG